MGVMLECEVQLPQESILGNSIVTLRLPSGLTEGDVILMVT